MIDFNKTEKLHNETADLIRKERLKDALEKMKRLAEEASDWNLRSELENMTETYNRMLEFMLQDMADPCRNLMYHNLTEKALILNDRFYRAINLIFSSTIYYKTLRENLKHPHLRNLHDTVQWATDMVQKEGNGHLTELQSTLFKVLWTSDIWSPSEREAMGKLLTVLPDKVAAMCVSGVTMGFLDMYDPQKYLFLFDAYEHPAAIVNQRAVVGIALGCLMHDNRMRRGEHDIYMRVFDMEKRNDFKKELQYAQMQILRSRETEKISKFMNEEFMPEMLKSPLLKRDKTGLDSLAIEDGMNPEWEKWIESKDVQNKMNIMNHLYSTGADVHMASFANMKNFPFFREISNWFLPFDSEHPDISPVTQDKQPSWLEQMRELFENSEFCDSDCYSLYLFMSSLSQNTQQMMGFQLPTIDEEMREKLREMYAQKNQREYQCKKYAQNIYRFYKLFSHRHEFTDIFKEETNLQFCDLLLPLLQEKGHLKEMAQFLLSQKHYEEAEQIYATLAHETEPTAETAQKRGFCMQQMKQYEEAIINYEEAELISPGNLWTLTHLAQCYSSVENDEKATQYYLMAEAIAPDDLSLQLQTGNSLAKMGDYEEAFKRFFKVHYLDEKNGSVWRAIAWYSLLAGKKEQAERFYRMIEENGCNENDLLNIGHMHWLNGHYKQAIKYYRDCQQKVGEETFQEMMMADEDNLLCTDMQVTDIPLILDLVKMA